MQALEDHDWRMFSTKEAKSTVEDGKVSNVVNMKKRKREAKAEKKQVVPLKKYEKLELKLSSPHNYYVAREKLIAEKLR